MRLFYAWGMPPGTSTRPRIHFFNLGGGPKVIRGGLGFTEGGLVHAVNAMAPLVSHYDVTVICPNVPDAEDTVREASIRGVRVVCPKPPLPALFMHGGELSAAERPLLTVLNWPSIAAGFVSQSRYLARSGADVVIANGILAAYLAGSVRGPWKTIAVIHHLYHDPWTTGSFVDTAGFHARSEKFLLSRLHADAIAVVNPSVASCLTSLGFAEEMVHFVGNGVSHTEFSFSPVHDVDVLLFVGRLRAAKGVESVLEAFSLIHERRKTAVLHIVGDGLLRPALESRAASLGLGRAVVFHGFVDEVTKVHLLQQASLYLSASRFEGFGLPVVEAMATGTVPVVSDIPSHRYILQGRDAGILASSVEDMADGALKLLQNPGLRLSMALVGRELVEQMWTWEGVAVRYRQLIDGLLG